MTPTTLIVITDVLSLQQPLPGQVWVPQIWHEVQAGTGMVPQHLGAGMELWRSEEEVEIPLPALLPPG